MIIWREEEILWRW